MSWTSPSPCHRLVSLDKKLYPTLSLSIQVYKMGAWDIGLGEALQYRLASYPGGISILTVASCYRNRVKLRPCEPPWLVCFFTLPCAQRSADDYSHLISCATRPSHRIYSKERRAVLIKFFDLSVARLFEGGAYSGATLI